MGWAFVSGARADGASVRWEVVGIDAPVVSSPRGEASTIASLLESNLEETESGNLGRVSDASPRSRIQPNAAAASKTMPT